MPRRLAGFAIVLVCLLAGSLARTEKARKFVSSLESKFLSNLPDYDFIKGKGESMAGAERVDANRAVVVRMDDAWRLGMSGFAAFGLVRNGARLGSVGKAAASPRLLAAPHLRLHRR